MEVAAHLKIPSLILEEDSLEVISALPKSQKVINWQIQSIIDDILSKPKFIPSWSVSHVYCSANY